MSRKLGAKPITILVIISQLAVGQELPIESAIREVNRQIFNTDGELPGFYTLTNKYHEVNFGKIKSETIEWPRDEKVIREFNPAGSMVRYQVYRSGKLNDDFTYEYADDGISLRKERGTYNLDYFQADSTTFFGVPALGNGKGFNFDLDTLLVHKSKFRYELTRKRKSLKDTSKRYVTQFTKNGSLLSVTIFENEVQTGHTINKYNDKKQVIERQDFWDYQFFANENEWTEYLSNRVYTFLYDSNGFIQKLTTGIYNPKARKWEIETQDFECWLELNDNLYIGRCKCSGADHLVLTIDKQGNWIEKEEYRNGEREVSTRSLIYYE